MPTSSSSSSAMVSWSRRERHRVSDDDLRARAAGEPPSCEQQQCDTAHGFPLSSVACDRASCTRCIRPRARRARTGRSLPSPLRRVAAPLGPDRCSLGPSATAAVSGPRSRTASPCAPPPSADRAVFAGFAGPAPASPARSACAGHGRIGRRTAAFLRDLSCSRPISRSKSPSDFSNSSSPPWPPPPPPSRRTDRRRRCRPPPPSRRTVAAADRHRQPWPTAATAGAPPASPPDAAATAAARSPAPPPPPPSPRAAAARGATAGRAAAGRAAAGRACRRSRADEPPPRAIAWHRRRTLPAAG